MGSIAIAFLTVGELAPATVEKYGHLVDLFRGLFSQSSPSTTKAEKVQLVLEEWNLRDGNWPSPEDLDRYQGVLIPGSAACAFDDTLPWLQSLLSLTKTVYYNKPHIKLIGICFGHQVIARALGGQCVKNEKGWEIGVAEVTLSETGRKLFGRDVLRIQQMHRDHVPVSPSPEFLVIGSTTIAPIQGLVKYYPGSADVHVFTLQGHPEFSLGSDIVTRIIDDREANGVFEKALAAKGRALARQESEGISIVGQLLWKILGEGAPQ
ncbi:glutamine amidotransferas-like protein class-I [Dacryopinax primogenitus]|uniref:Glutamine amidotransferas-like protein class-I n=1 Tax=Dacryopinax primogenitus (strain DJM 731) TaxID=1858805 RepID=M5G1G3_DACPD|nr:glutamine amidotransferas-like protein class-I [Dacryopinax primogenitus]EJT99666.1 glutamine amidotransferas-like protein class-I [Dacryopinax primogenitus]